MLGDLCKRRDGEIAAAERDPLAVESLDPERRRGSTRDRESLRAEGEQHQAHDKCVELELPGYAVARVDS